MSHIAFTTFRLALLGVAMAVTTAAGAAAQAKSAAPNGYLFIVGGGPQPPGLVQQFVDLAGGTGKARIVVMAMASSDGLKSGDEKAADLVKLGASAINIWANHDQANTDSVAHLLDGATGIWFGGGDQVLLAKALRGTKTEAAIRARYLAGAVVGGTSAGAAVMSTPMITGDERKPGGDRPPSDKTDFMTVARGNVVVDSGFALLHGAIVDQHFIRRKRSNRLLSLVLEMPPHLGVGIDESTAVIVHPDGHWTVAGASAAIVFDARKSAVTPDGARVLGATGVMVHVLPAGSSYDPRSGRVSLPP
ncbi:MAG: cyanophycinase [Gemmatimonadaceae bacterium]